MRAFRDPLRALGAAVAALAASMAAASGGTPAGGHAYFPLAVGNSWAYACSTEGRPARGKELRITQRIARGDSAVYRAELKVSGDPRPLVQFLFVDADGAVRRSLTAEAGDAEVLIGPDVGAGTRHGPWTSAGTEQLSVPALRRVAAVKLENFPVDNAQLPQDKRDEWLARYYAKGIGPVGEADGLGGRCDLKAYRLSNGSARPPQ
jgi:hypothetical protein